MDIHNHYFPEKFLCTFTLKEEEKYLNSCSANHFMELKHVMLNKRQSLLFDDSLSGRLGHTSDVCESHKSLEIFQTRAFNVKQFQQGTNHFICLENYDNLSKLSEFEYIFFFIIH